jgi:hypothetical protein
MDKDGDRLKKNDWANLQSGYKRKDGITRYYRGSWQCINKCKLEKA